MSKEIKDIYVKYGANESNIKIFHNGASSLIQFESVGKLDKAICLAKVEYRKGQQYLSELENIDIAGPIHNFEIQIKNYIRHWTRDDIKQKLTNYKTLVLLSNGEAHSLSICEALMSGLSLVISRVASANLDTSKPWIHVIDDSKFKDTEYIQTVINKSIYENDMYRQEIREYALSMFSWDKIAETYV